MTDNSKNIYDRTRMEHFESEPFCALYMQHMDRMTVEGLHAKSEIAVELAWRDLEIQRLNEAAEAHTLYITRVDELGYELGAVATDYVPTFLKNFTKQQKDTETQLRNQIANDTALWNARHDAQVEELEGHEATITTLTAERDQLTSVVAFANQKHLESCEQIQCLTAEIEKLKHEAERRGGQLDLMIDECIKVEAERDQARNAIILCGSGNDFDWKILGELDRLRTVEASIPTEVNAVIDLLPAGSHVVVREGGGPEDPFASLAVSVAKGCELFKKALSDQQAQSDKECLDLTQIVGRQGRTIQSLQQFSANERGNILVTHDVEFYLNAWIRRSDDVWTQISYRYDNYPALNISTISITVEELSAHINKTFGGGLWKMGRLNIEGVRVDENGYILGDEDTKEPNGPISP